ncbi:hypothetical protein J3P96_02445 [Pseudomonas sp. R3-56]|uniref:hypothetical protein n=1 Tax=Pseudomonas sp. R3-56 TaxID=2817401 RepID=UPI003DA85BA9
MKKSPHKAGVPSPTKQYLVGYHGTTDDSAKRLFNRGVLEEYSGANSKPEDLVLGEGFYTAKDPGVAEEYARSLLVKSERTVVLEVYVTDMPSKAPGIDYYRGKGASEGIKSFRPHIYKDISFKYYSSLRRKPMADHARHIRQ